MAPTILLLEDNPLDERFFRDVLWHSGYRVLSAPDPVHGLNLALSDRPNLMIVDNLLAAGFGAEAIREIRTDARLARIPIIATSSYATAAERSKMKDAGCTIFMHKPIAVESLLATVGRLIYSEPTARH